ncbi:MAG TPA: hypothetical protein VGT60_11070 [Candidatus Limnocylindria bacterium]|nr:hypothetical protein [Candidatus Limnocylindria bacterium]
MRAVIAAAILGLVAGCTATSVAPSPTAGRAADPSPTTTPAPTNAPPSATGARHLNDVLGFAVTVPAPWHVSECQSGVTREGPYLGQDVLTWRTAAEEHDLGGGGDTGGSGAFTWVITIAAQIDARSAAEFAAAQGGSVGDTVETTTIDGRPAIRKADGLTGRATYYVANEGRVYAIGLSIGVDPTAPSPPANTRATFDAIARSLTFVTPTARPTPTPAPQLSAAVTAVVDAVAAAFAASDADTLRELMPPTCWFTSAGYASSGVELSRERMADLLRTSFAQGRRVTVESRPINADAPYVRGPFWVWSTWSAYNAPSFSPESVTQLVFDQIDGRWYWTGALFNAGSLKPAR